MNQLNQIQEKLQSNVISDQELMSLRGKRGKVYKGGYNSFPDTTESNPVRPSGGNASPTVVVSSTQQSTIEKFGTRRIV